MSHHIIEFDIRYECTITYVLFIETVNIWVKTGVLVFSNLCIVPNGASGLSILGCPFGLLERLFKDHRLIRTATGSVQISIFLYNSGGNLSRLDPDIHSLYK
jgi:hypothetical protein